MSSDEFHRETVEDQTGDQGLLTGVSDWRRKTAQPREKIALVLAGGGITGSVYEIGALRAIDDMLVGLTVNDFDIFVGTSAGALVSALVANGFTPHEIMQMVDKSHPELGGVHVGNLFHTNLGGALRRLRKLPNVFYKMGRHSLRHMNELAVTDLFWELAQLLPSGLYDGAALERYMRAILEQQGATNRFDRLDKELYIVATELETGARAVFGQGGKSIVPISQAVAASSAVPVLYRPVSIFRRDYIDGGLHGSASVDLAIEAGAKLVVCINPMVPLNTVDDGRDHYIRDRGLQAIINQSVRTLLHGGIRYHIKNVRAKYPDVDIILIEPQWNDYRMFSYNPMHYGSRLSVAEHGFESVTVGLSEYYDFYSSILSRHNIELDTALVTEELADIRASGEDLEVMQHVIERTDADSTLNMALSNLERSLKQLEMALT